MQSTKPISEDEHPPSEAEDEASLARDLPPTASEPGTYTLPPAVPTEQEQRTVASLDAALSSLTLSEPTADNRMFRALATIFEASQLHDARIALDNSSGDDVWTLLQRADARDAEGLSDIQSLAAIKDVMDQMLLLRSQFLIPTLKIIADKSREGCFPTNFLEVVQALISVQRRGDCLLGGLV